MKTEENKPTYEQLEARIAHLERALTSGRENISMRVSNSHEECYKILFDTITQGIVFHDQSGKIISANHAAEEILGVAFSSMNEQSINEIRWKAIREDGRDFPQHEHPAFRALASGNIEHEVEMGVYNPTKGDIVWIRVNAIPLFRNGESKPYQVYSCFEDITSDKLVARMLKNSQEYNRVLFYHSNIPLVVMNTTHFKFVDCNAAAIKIYGYSRIEDVLSLSPIDVSYHTQYDGTDSRIAVKARIAECMSKGEAVFEWKHIRPSGQVWDALVHLIKFTYDNEVLLLFSLVDISENKATVRALQLKTEELERYFNFSPDLLCIADYEGYFRKLNTEWSNTLGYDVSELINRKFMDFVHPDDQSATIEKLADLGKNIHVLNFANRYLHKNGTYRWIEWRSFPVESYIYAVARDITNRKEAEIHLAESEERYKMVSQFTTDYIFKLGVQDDFTITVDFISDNYYTLTGRTKETVANIEKWHEFIHKDDLPGLIKLLKEIITLGKSGSIEVRSTAKDGQRWIQVHASPLLDKHTGKVVKILGAVKDINKEKMVFEKLVDSEEKFRTLFENITEGVALHQMIYDDLGNDLDYILTNVNPAYKVHTGIGEEVIGKKGTEVYGVTPSPYLEEFGYVARNRIPYHFETYFPPLEKYFLVSVVSPKQGQFATVFEDITDRRRREDELKSRNEELARFMYTVSHDLKSPLVTIKAFTSYLLEDIEENKPEAIAKDLKFINNAADKMGVLLEELLELSRVGRKDNPRQEVALKQVVNAAIDLVAGRISKRNVKVTVTDDPVFLFCDFQRILQLFQNLLDNAVKFMGNQQNPVVEIGVEMQKNKHVIFVRDNGVGIDGRYKNKLFNLFEKLDPNSEGTGIGLALVKRIVETHDGTIWFESGGVGQGTTFYFTIEKTYLKS